MAASSQDPDDEISGINVTPLVDIMLVLLIIFMVTTSMIREQGMKMDLPKAAGDGAVQQVFAVELTADGKTFVDQKPIATDSEVTSLAAEAFKKNKEVRAVIRADKTVQHGRVIRVLDLLKRAKVAKIAFAVAPASDVELKK